MSGITAIYSFSEAPANSSLLARMTESISYRGPDGVAYWCEGKVGLGYRALHTTPESSLEIQPLKSANSELVLVFDGRVDNREELVAELEAREQRIVTNTDAEIVLKSYELWEEEAFRYVIGDFALVLWDNRRRKLICARDILGIKPLYFHYDEHRFLCASEIHPLFEDPATPKRPNEGLIGEYLIDRITNREETLFKGIFRLEPAHYLVVQDRSVSKRRYYDIDPTYQIQYRDDRDYAAHFHELLTQAVACRMRSSGGVGSELSGGLDSSSVASIAQRLFLNGSVSCTAFETFSGVFPGQPYDESEYIRAVLDKTGIRGNLFTVPPAGYDTWRAIAERYMDFPSYPNGLMNRAATELAERKGIRVLLTGVGGDNWLGGSTKFYADLLYKLQLLELVRALRKTLSARGATLNAKNRLLITIYFMRQTLSPFIPRLARRILRRITNSSHLWEFLRPEFVQRNALAERINFSPPMPRFSTYAQTDLYREFVSGAYNHALQEIERLGAHFNIEVRHPFNDRRIIEFTFAIPETQRCRDGVVKYVLREAMRDILPERVRQRLDKAEFSGLIVRELQYLGGEKLFQGLKTAQEGWLQENRVIQMYRELSEARTPDETRWRYLWRLWRIFGIELWFRTVFLERGAQHEDPALGSGRAL